MPNYFQSNGIKRTQKLGFNRKFVIYEKDLIIFELFVDDFLERFQVYSVRYTNWIKYSDYKYSVKKAVLKETYPKEHPYTCFGSFFGRTDRATSQIVWLIFRGVFKKPRDFIFKNLAQIH